MQKAVVVGVAWAIASAAWVAGCGDTGYVHSHPPEKCSAGSCCPDIAWVLLAPTQTQVGGAIGLEVSLPGVSGDGSADVSHDVSGEAPNVLWRAEGGSLEHPLEPQATYTCEWPGFHQVTLTVSNQWCAVSQIFHVECQDAFAPNP